MGNQVCNNISHLTNGYPIACPFFHFLLPCPFITQPDRLLNTLWLEPMGLTNVIYAGFDDLNGKTQTSCAFKKCKSVWVSLRKVLDHRRNSPLSIYLYIYIFLSHTFIHEIQIFFKKKTKPKKTPDFGIMVLSVGFSPAASAKSLPEVTCRMLSAGRCHDDLSVKTEQQCKQCLTQEFQGPVHLS